MNIEIIDKKENILLSRIEVQAKISFEKATPSKEEVKKALSKELQIDSELIVIKHIKTAYGEMTAIVLAYQYLSKDDLKAIEPKKKAETKKPDKEEKKESKKEGVKKEKKVEPKKEQAKEEKKDQPKESAKEEKKTEPKENPPKDTPEKAEKK